MMSTRARAAKAAAELKLEMEFINDIINETIDDYHPNNIDYQRLNNDNTFNNETKEIMSNILYQHYKIMKQHINSYTMLLKDTFIRKEQSDGMVFNTIRNYIIYNEQHDNTTTNIYYDTGLVYKLLENYANIFYKFSIENFKYKIIIAPEPEPNPDNECPICLQDLKKTPKWIIKCLTCKNIYYHLGCIEKHWQTCNKACPVCKQKHNTAKKDYIFVHKDNINKYICAKSNDGFLDD